MQHLYHVCICNPVPRAIMPCWFPQHSVSRTRSVLLHQLLMKTHTLFPQDHCCMQHPTCTQKRRVCKYRATWTTANIYEKYIALLCPLPLHDRKENKFLSWIRSRLVRHGEPYLSGLIRVCWKQPPRPCLRRKIASFIYRCLALFLQSIPYWDAISQETLPVHGGLSFPIAGARNEAHTKGKKANQKQSST